MKTKKSHLATALAVAAMVVSAHAHAAVGTLTDLGAFTPFDVNNAGEVLGTDFQANMLVWRDGASSAVPGTVGAHGWPAAFNDAGVVVGSAPVGPYGTQHAMSWSGGQARDLGTLANNITEPFGGPDSYGYGINKAGQIVGTSAASNDPITFATVWNNGTATNLGALDPRLGSTAFDINNKAQAVGVSWVMAKASSRAVMWQNGAIIELSSRTDVDSSAVAINDAGQSAGYVGSHAAMWQGTSLQELGAISGGTSSRAKAINNAGWVVGSSGYMSSSVDHAVLWVDGRAIDLNSLLTDEQRAAGWTLTSADAINDQGWIAGKALIGDPHLGNTHGYLLSVSAVPETGTLSMMLVALGGAVAGRRIRGIRRAGRAMDH